MTRQQLIEQILRQVYGGQPSDDSAITYNLVNQYINQGIGLAVKQNYKDSIQLDGVGYVNNSFYTTFKGLSISKDENFLWKIVLPEVPMGIGHNEGMANLRLKNSTNDVSLDCLPLSTNQKGYVQTMKNIPNKVLYYVEGSNALILSSLTLSQYTASVTLISGGDSTSLSSTLNVPADYIPMITNYAMQALMIERKQPQDQTNDGVSN